MAVTDGIQVLSQGVGYGMVVGIGGFFALFMLGLTFLQNRYTAFSTHQAEEFNTASRSVKPGLIAAGIVSSWTWSATLLTSSTFAYNYGICGGMWYAAMGTCQIMLFSLIAIKVKMNAPGAHTFPEIILAKHGRIAHITYLFFGLATNMLVGACLVLGGSQTVSALTGVNVYAACFLIPLVVAVYVVAGGLRSTFIADYTHTVILFISIFAFGFTMYATGDVVGSPSRFYDLLVEASEKMPIASNHKASYLTFRSVDGLIFAIDLLVSGFCTVWLDQAYWQRAIASKPETSVKAYLLGGLAWYGIPFGFANAMGLGCAALTLTPAFPTYPSPLTAAQTATGLSSPASAIALLGTGGAGLMLLLLFMAVTSSTSAELIAVSSLLTFDVYKTYLRPSATSHQLVQISHYGIILFAIVLAVFCSILNAASLNLTWLLTCLGIMVGGASVPVGLVLLWEKMSTVATVATPWIGLGMGVVGWMVTTWKRSGVISVETTGLDVTNAAAGNLISCGGGAVLAVVLSLAWPEKHESLDAEHVARANKINGIPPAGAGTPPAEVAQATEKREEAGEKTAEMTEPETVATAAVELFTASHFSPIDPVEARKAERLAVAGNLLFILVAVVLVPFTLFGTGYVFSKRFFTGWVVVSFMWVWCSMVICVIWPVVESRRSLVKIFKGMAKDIGTAGGGKGEERPVGAAV